MTEIHERLCTDGGVKAPTHFMLGDTLYHRDLIEMVQVDGGISRCHGCWGKIRLKGQTEDLDIGDGSYEHDRRHIPHKVVRGPDGKPDFGFAFLRKIMANLANIPQASESPADASSPSVLP